ncbi:MAG TPA: hypothetical protein VHZ95_22320 [Polyangiales bacterium]|nr:hypothetical protein [Polyangiales bacterium]
MSICMAMRCTSANVSSSDENPGAASPNFSSATLSSALTDAVQPSMSWISALYQAFGVAAKPASTASGVGFPASIASVRAALFSLVSAAASSVGIARESLI